MDREHGLWYTYSYAIPSSQALCTFLIYKVKVSLLLGFFTHPSRRSYPCLRWSPCSRYLAIARVDEGHIPPYHIVHQGKDGLGEDCQVAPHHAHIPTKDPPSWASSTFAPPRLDYPLWKSRTLPCAMHHIGPPHHPCLHVPRRGYGPERLHRVVWVGGRILPMILCSLQPSHFFFHVCHACSLMHPCACSPP